MPGETMTDTKAQGYLDAAAWHEQQVVAFRRKLRKGEAWAEEHGEANAGTIYTDYIPRFIEIHELSARHFRRIAKRRLASPAPPRAPTETDR